jgi:hypothetical protein
MSDRFEQQSQSLLDYAEPPTEPLLARPLTETDTSASHTFHLKKQKLKPFGARNGGPDRPA